MTADEAKIVAFTTLIGSGLMLKAIRTRQKIRRIEDTPRSKAATAPQGYVELEGFAWPVAETARAISGDEIVYYRLELQRSEMRGTGKNRRREWVTVFTHAYSPAFYLVDATGLALVDLGAAAVDSESRRTRDWGKLGAEEQSRLAGLVGGTVHAFPPRRVLRWFFTGSYRVLEREIAVGNPVYAHGDFRALAPEASRARVPGLGEFVERVFDRGTRGLRNLDGILDKDRDGAVSAEEARSGYGFAARRARAKAQAGAASATEFAVCGRLGTSVEHPLLVADLHERHLVRRRGRFVWIQFFVGAALLALGATVLVGGLTGRPGAPTSVSE